LLIILYIEDIYKDKHYIFEAVSIVLSCFIALSETTTDALIIANSFKDINNGASNLIIISCAF
jgi:hypothetical protein